MTPPHTITQNTELIRHIFAILTALAEDTAEIAVEGQSPHIAMRTTTHLARQLIQSADDMAALAHAVTVIANRSGD
jgi:hydrogenase maturation factor